MCFADRDLVHESNKPVLKSLYNAFCKSKRLIVLVSKEFMEDYLMKHFLKSRVVHRISTKDYKQEHIVFIVLDNTEIPESISSDFTKSQYWQWNKLNVYQQRNRMLKFLLSNFVIEHMKAVVLFIVFLLLLCNGIQTDVYFIFIIICVFILSLLSLQNDINGLIFTKSKIVCFLVAFVAALECLV